VSVIYEVSLEVEPSVAGDFSIWLRAHIKDMLELPGFIDAALHRELRDGNPAPAWVVRYQLESPSSLDDYFREHAERMRSEGIRRFADKFSARRRILLSEAS
jgi:hypothetical protein